MKKCHPVIITALLVLLEMSKSFNREPFTCLFTIDVMLVVNNNVPFSEDIIGNNVEAESYLTSWLNVVVFVMSDCIHSEVKACLAQAPGTTSTSVVISDPKRFPNQDSRRPNI